MNKLHYLKRYDFVTTYDYYPTKVCTDQLVSIFDLGEYKHYRNNTLVADVFICSPKRCGLFGQLRGRGGVQNDPMRDSGLWKLQF